MKEPTQQINLQTLFTSVLAWSLALIVYLIFPVPAEASEEGTCSPRPVNPPPAGASSPLAKYSQVYDGCDITPVGDRDLFSFYANKGDKVSITATWQSGPGRGPCARLLDPAGIEIISWQCAGYVALVEPLAGLAKSGYHLVQVKDWGDSATMTYSLAIHCLAGRCNSAVLPGPPDMTGNSRDEWMVRRGNRYLIDSLNNGRRPEKVIRFGRADDLVFAAQMDADAKDELVIRRGARYFIDMNNNGGAAEKVIVFGRAHDLVFPADVNGDGRDELVIKRANRYLIDADHNGGAAERVIIFGGANENLFQGFGSQ